MTVEGMSLIALWAVLAALVVFFFLIALEVIRVRHEIRRQRHEARCCLGTHVDGARGIVTRQDGTKGYARYGHLEWGD